MKFALEIRPKVPTLAMTSMLDVIFLLLCFFVTVSVFSQWESEVTIALPGAETATEPERLPGEIIINLAEDGSIKVNGASLTVEDLGSRLKKVSKFFPGQPVIIRADKAVKYEKLMSVIDTCRGADVWNFSLAVQETEAK